MTTNELRNYMNQRFGLDTWPETLEVDANTYANVVYDLIKNLYRKSDIFNQAQRRNENFRICLTIDKDGNVLFKNVGLILKQEQN